MLSMDNELKVCGKCNLEKSVSQFHIDKKTKKYFRHCKICVRQKNNFYGENFDGYINKLYLCIKHNLKKRAKKLEFDITKDDIKTLYHAQNGLCALTGKPLTHYAYRSDNSQTKNYWNISVDRIDPSKGYVRDNIQIVGVIVNIMKTDLSDEEFLLLVRDIVMHNYENIDAIEIENAI